MSFIKSFRDCYHRPHVLNNGSGTAAATVKITDYSSHPQTQAKPNTRVVKATVNTKHLLTSSPATRALAADTFFYYRLLKEHLTASEGELMCS